MPTPRGGFGAFCDIQRGEKEALHRHPAPGPVGPALPQWQLWLEEWEHRQQLRLQDNHRSVAELLDGMKQEVLDSLADQRGLVEQVLDAVASNSLKPPLALSVIAQGTRTAQNENLVLPKGPDRPDAGARDDDAIGRLMKPNAVTVQFTRINEELAAAVGMSAVSSSGSNSHYVDDLTHFEPSSKLQSQLCDIVHSHYFQIASGVLVLTYTLVIGVQSHMDMVSALQGCPTVDWRATSDIVFTSIFLFEVLLRMSAERLFFLRGPGRVWNFFDLLVVVSGLVELAGVFEMNLTFLRILRSVRAIRVLRVIRIFRFFAELRWMAASIFTCLVSLIWAFILLLTVMYIFAVVLMQGAGDYLRQGQSVPDEVRIALEEDFAGIFRTIFSLTQAISGGRSWGEYAEPFVTINPAYGVGFTVFVVFVIFGVLNILTGVFVQNTSAVAHYDRELIIEEEMKRNESTTNQIRSLFSELDKDKNGTISLRELKKNLSDSRVKAYFGVMGLDVQEATGLFNLLDADESGEVGIEEFIMTCMRLKGQAKSIDLAAMLFENKKMHKLLRTTMNTVHSDILDLKQVLLPAMGIGA
mmetsp:Transcript_3368/g.7728  ORF Transcript_3368/g.7728 Transcript_3368/m.7728 type:complete len:583 (+) Transcript_3368:189-1937(+)